MVSHFTRLSLTFWLLLCSGNFVYGKRGQSSQKKTKTKTLKPLKDLSDNWGHVLLYEGCFQLGTKPTKEKRISKNSNDACSYFCHKEDMVFAATTGDRCFCYRNRPTGTVRLPRQQCDTPCPNLVRSDDGRGSSCEGIACCGSVAKNAVSLIQTIPIFPHRTANDSKKGHHPDATVASHRDGFGSFIIPEGCFKMTGVDPARTRNDPHNVNSECIDYCVQSDITYAATISELCLCLNDIPSDKLNDGECNFPCPGYILPEGTLCYDLGCCGSQDNDAVSVYRAVPASRDQSIKKSRKKNQL